MSNRFSLPASIIGRIDVSRLIRELGALEEYLIAARIRNPHSEIIMPRVSLLLELLAKSNSISLMVDDQRKSLETILMDIREHAPSVQVSFASNPSAAMIEKLVQWFRREAHPYTMIQTGLQPSLAAGCMLRTPNRIFDLSLRKKLDEQKPLLIEALIGEKSGSSSKPIEVNQETNHDTDHVANLVNVTVSSVDSEGQAP
jgi:hypothetical protein